MCNSVHNVVAQLNTQYNTIHTGWARSRYTVIIIFSLHDGRELKYILYTVYRIPTFDPTCIYSVSTNYVTLNAPLLC
jgi:hypothetical protein